MGKSDEEIAREAGMLPIEEVAAKIGIGRQALELYGDYKAKIREDRIEGLAGRPDGKLILVTAISPTPAGEGKTTVAIGLGDALQRLGLKSAIVLREPSLGPVFGRKGGACGGGYAQVVPMEEINLHFTGDIHAVGAANNLLAAMIDNHIYFGNPLGIDPRRITWKRAVDINDRQLRSIVAGLGGNANGVPREDGFQITAASEVMAILCLSENLAEMKERLKNIIVGYTRDGRPVTCGDLKAHGAMAALLKDALKPNLVQTLEHTPAFVHGGPFANIAHGCSSIKAARLALKCADYVVTEAGFGSDLGAEKFFDINCRLFGLKPAAAVVVATVRALKMHGGAALEDVGKENLDALAKGFPNLSKHVENMQKVFGLPAVVAINRFPSDSEAELDWLAKKCEESGVKAVRCEVWAKGGAGGEALAREAVKLAERDSRLSYAYDLDDPIPVKIEKLVRRVYGGKGIEITAQAEKAIGKLERMGCGNLPICVAKTPYSLSDDPKKLGRPADFTVTVRDVKCSAGAGFLVVFTGDVQTMPGLPKKPAAESIDVDGEGRISGLF
jgi:formate--tetrahydrofolate ligase